jgi:hypothetical protein
VAIKSTGNPSEISRDDAFTFFYRGLAALSWRAPTGTAKDGHRHPMNSFFSELKRRNVYKVAVAYAVVGWLLVQIATQTFPFFDIPNWAIRLVILLVVIGFPVALIVAWAFELTPEGLKRTESAEDIPQKQSGGRAWIYVVIAAGMLSVALFFLGRYTAPRISEVGRVGDASLPVSVKSIAVLPFENRSEDKANAYFADGIAVQREQPTNVHIVSGLAVAHAGLGNKGAALREGERSMAMLPATEDPVTAPVIEEIFAGTEVDVGEFDDAVARLERLLTTPYGAYPVTQAALRLDPSFDPVRSHPRFQKLVSGPEPKTIYK